MNNHEDTNIEMIQCNLSSEAIAPIKGEIRNLIASIKRPDTKLIRDDKDLHIQSRNFRSNLPDGFGQTLLAIKIDAALSYIEIFSNGTIRQLETSLPGLKGTHIAKLIHAQTKSKCLNLTLEKEKCLAYKPVCRRVRQEIVTLNKRISEAAPDETLRNLICAPQHAFAIASFQNSRVSLGTVDLGSCIGLVVINPIRQRAAITHLDHATIETYKTSLQLMFAMVTDKNDKCQIYLIGGAEKPKEEFKRWRNGSSLSSLSRL